MHVIESGDVAKPVATLSPLTKLSSNDAYYSTLLWPQTMKEMHGKQVLEIGEAASRRSISMHTFFGPAPAPQVHR